eukprot:Hpha_TRINITY_DN5802_c0_g1::TRINITY_DN5802_c0_g1_i1::g.45638::m.45638
MRYSYYLWCAVTWRDTKGQPHEQVLRLPFRVCNPLASLRPIRPPFAPPGWECRWRQREVQLKDEPRGQGHWALCNPLAAELGRLRSTQTPSPIGDPGVEEVEDFVLSPVAPSAPDPLIRSPSISGPPSPASEMGDLLQDERSRQGDRLQMPTTPVSIFVDAFNSIESLVAITPPVRCTPVCPATSARPFCHVLTAAEHLCVGDTVAGVVRAELDCDVTFLRCSVRLEYEERVPAELFKQGTHVPNPPRAFPALAPDAGFAARQTTQTVVVEDFEEIMLDCLETNFEFVLAAHYPTSLYTDKASVEWFLRFEFDYAPAGEDPAAGGAPPNCMEPILWQLPLVVHTPYAALSKKMGPTQYSV